MKRWTGCLFAVILLASCTSFPKPDNDQSCLIVGNIIAEFPDGFFTDAPRRIAHSVQVAINDLDENKPLRAVTSINGYFYFIGKPGHQYLLEGWEVNLDEGSRSFHLGPNKLGLTFSALPEKVTYLKNILYTYRRPKRGDERGYTTSWNFDVSISVTSTPDGAREFIETKQKGGGGWLDQEIEAVDLQKS